MFTTQQPQFLERVAWLARGVSSDVPGLSMEMRFTAIAPAPWDAIVSPYLRP